MSLFSHRMSEQELEQVQVLVQVLVEDHREEVIDKELVQELFIFANYNWMYACSVE
jgi:hypothetical protein